MSIFFFNQHRFISLIFLFFCSILFANDYLFVKTVPENIQVWIDQFYVGQSPVYVDYLKPGYHSLKLIDPISHYSFSDDIYVKPDDTTYYEKTIEPQFGILHIYSEPPNASVLIGSELGQTPLQNEYMNPGKYRIEIRHQNPKYCPIVEYVNVIQGKTTSLTKTLEKQKKFNKKATLRLILGAGCAAGFVFAIIENGNYEKYQEKLLVINNSSSKLRKKRNNSNLFRILGISGGCICLTGLEIISFF